MREPVNNDVDLGGNMMLRALIFAIITYSTIVLCETSSQAQSIPEQTLSASRVLWEPLSDFDDLFPSYILATSTAKTKQVNSPNYIGDPFGLIGIMVKSSAPNTQVKFILDVDNIAERTEFETTLSKPGSYRIYPPIRYKYHTLSNIKQPVTVNASFSLSIDGATPLIQVQRLRVRSVNDAVLTVKTANGRVINKKYAFAAFVNENHPAIDKILREALNIPVPIVREFVGYQAGPDEVIKQIFAIWYLFERWGFTYSSITTPTGYTDKVQSQFVRFLEDSLSTQQSNCIDGTVLFASILRKIGIDPIIVLIPGHAFLGFWIDSEHKSAKFLETTMMNSDANPYRTQKRSKFLDTMARTFQTDLKLRPALQGFYNALAVGEENYSKNLSAFQTQEPGYQLIEIEEMRRLGIQPIAH